MSNHSSKGTEWNAIRLRVLKKYNYECQYQFEGCTGEATDVDHYLPKVMGGTDEDENLYASCKNCNTKKGATILTRGQYLNSKWLN